jgi:hypothetical protein
LYNTKKFAICSDLLGTNTMVHEGVLLYVQTYLVWYCGIVYVCYMFRPTWYSITVFCYMFELTLYATHTHTLYTAHFDWLVYYRPRTRYTRHEYRPTTRYTIYADT